MVCFIVFDILGVISYIVFLYVIDEVVMLSIDGV